MDFKSIIFVMCIGIVWAQAEPSITDALNKLPPGLQRGKIDEIEYEELRYSEPLDLRQCEENGGPGAYQKAEGALLGFGYCLREASFDIEKLVQEVKEAKPRGQVGEVFKKFCQNMPEFKVCFKEMTEKIKPCFSVDEQNNLKTVISVIDQLADFVCFKEGNRIALFISENGTECIQEKKPDILSCLESTLGTQMDSLKTKYRNAYDFLKFNFGEVECNLLGKVQTCVVSALESCPAPNSARNAESLFKLARKATPCGDPNSASGLAVTSLTLSVIALALLV